MLLSVLLFFQLEPAVKADMVKALQRVNFFKVSFKQQTYSDFFDEAEAEGVLYVARPGKFRMDYTKGEQKSIICNGSDCYEYDAFADSRSDYSQAEIKDKPLSRLLLYGGDLEEIFIMDRVREEDTWHYRFRPREEDNYTITIRFNEQWLPVYMEIQDQEGEGTRFWLRDYDVATPLVPDLFEIPAGSKQP